MAAGIPTFDQFRRSLAGTPMAGEAQGIYNAAIRGGINPAFVAGLASAESGYGKEGYAVGSHNPFGLGVHLGWKFPNYTKATERLAKTLKGLGYPDKYKQSGLAGIISQYTPYGDASNDPMAHTRNIISAGKRTGGNPSKVYIGQGVVPMAPPSVGGGGGGSATPQMIPSSPSQSQAPGVSVSNELRQALLRQYQMSREGTLTPDVAHQTTLGLARLAGTQQAQSLIPQAAASTGGGVSYSVETPTSGRATTRSGGPVETAMTNYGSTKGVVRPLPTAMGGGDYGYSDPEGQDGRHLADDWFAPGNTPVAAPVGGTVFRVRPDEIPGKAASGGLQVFGGSVYIKDDNGRVWVFRHLENPQKYTQAGKRIVAGQRIGGVKQWGDAPHTHIELYSPGPYQYSSARAMDPNQFFRQAGIR